LHGLVDKLRTFWKLQIAGWGSYALVVALGITFGVDSTWQHRELYIVEGAFILSKFVASMALHRILRSLWWRMLSGPMMMVAAGVFSVALAIPCASIAQTMQLRTHNLPLDWQHFRETWIHVIYASFVLISWSALYLGIKHYEALRVEKERTLRAESLLSEARLQALRYQLNPHFIFNTLNVISALILDDQPETANRVLGQLAGFLRLTLDHKDVQQVSLTQEIAATRQYLAIEEARLGDKLHIEMNLAPTCNDALVPTLLLQPLVENAVRHGISRKQTPGKLIIRADRDGENLRILVSDDGCGIKDEQVRRSGGIGLTNTIERLRVMYGENQRLSIEWLNEGGCNVQVEFPYRTANNHKGELRQS
jgi:two-component system, LytTR family, sensor kinase